MRFSNLHRRSGQAGLIAGLLVAVTLPSAKAGGFVSYLDPSLWTLDGYVNGAQQTGFPKSFPAYECTGGPLSDPPDDFACIADLSPGGVNTLGSFTLVGPTENDIGGAGTDAWVEYVLQYTGTQSMALIFDLIFDTNDTTNGIKGYIDISNTAAFNPINDTPNTYVSSFDDAQVNFSTTLNPGNYIRFGVLSADIAIGKWGTLEITNFDANIVPTPAPLPALGAVAAWGWSKRLRSRIRRSAQ